MMQLLALVLLALVPGNARAHVKWFSSHRLDQPPVSFASLDQPAFWALLALSIATLALFVVADRYLERWPAYRRLNAYLESYVDRAPLILRIFTGASLLLSWQADAMIAPELRIPGSGWGAYQFAIALLLLFRATTPMAGAMMIGLWAFAAARFGIYHLLDYLVYPAIGYFLLVSNAGSRAVRDTRVPALYVGLGFSLCWAALEKVFYPEWGLEVLNQHPALTMGLPFSFFLLSCAFIELCLGYLLIIGLLQRPLALTITLVFFTTTAFFGKTEIVGHTLLHGALLVFIVMGPGSFYRPPIAIHRNLGLRAAFAAVNFVVVIAALGFAYRAMAEHQYEHHRHEAAGRIAHAHR